MASNEIEILDPSVTVEKLNKIATRRALNRRSFIAALGMTGAAAGAGMMSGCTTSNVVPVATGATPGQIDVLNFLLNVKYLQATFYSFVTKGTDLAGVTNSGAVTGSPAKVTFTGTNATQITDMFDEIYFDDTHHVAALQTLLSASAIFRPAINLAAYGAITAINAIGIARMLEDVAVTAYAGAVSGLSSSSVTVTSQIFGVDGFHSGALRLVSLQNPTIAADVSAGTLDVPPYDPGTAVLAAAGPTGKGGFFATAGATTSTSVDPAGFAFVRTTSQVLAILYGSPGAAASSGTASGGFFPSGLSGNITKV